MNKKIAKDLKIAADAVDSKITELLGLPGNKLLAALNIRDVKRKYNSGKRSTVYDSETSNLSEKESFITDLKQALQKYGMPIKVTYEDIKYPTDEELRHTRMNEREWDQLITTMVTVYFEKHQTVQSEFAY